MKFTLKNIASKIGNTANKAWRFLSGKKRLIAIGCGLISQIIPEHTAIGGGADWIRNNLDYINIGLEVTAGLFGTTAIIEHGIKTYKEKKLPSGLAGGESND